jgi:hypothetical protein
MCWSETWLLRAGRRGHPYLANNFHNPGAPALPKRRRILLPRITSQGQQCCDHALPSLASPTILKSNPSPSSATSRANKRDVFRARDCLGFRRGSSAWRGKYRSPSAHDAVTRSDRSKLADVVAGTFADEYPDGRTEADLRTRYQVSDRGEPRHHLRPWPRVPKVQ